MISVSDVAIAWGGALDKYCVLHRISNCLSHLIVDYRNIHNVNCYATVKCPSKEKTKPFLPGMAARFA